MYKLFKEKNRQLKHFIELKGEFGLGRKGYFPVYAAQAYNLWGRKFERF